MRGASLLKRLVSILALAAFFGAMAMPSKRLETTTLGYNMPKLQSSREAGFDDLAHVPAMAHADRLAGERIGLEGGEEQRHVGHVLDRGEFLVHRLCQHDLLDHALLADAELLRLLWDLLLNQRRLDETWADHIGAHAMRGALLGHHPGKAKQAVLGGHVGCLQRRGLVAVHRPHVEEHA